MTNNTEVRFIVSKDDALKIVELVDKELGILFEEVKKLEPPYPGKLIFMSYRREDSRDICGRVYDHLLPVFGKDSLFRDIESLSHGKNFLSGIEKNAAACQVMLVFIGPDWLNRKNKARIQSDDDPVRVEIETALSRSEREVAVIPVIVNNAKVPQKTQLPIGLRSLSSKNAVFLHPDEDFHGEVAKLITAIREHLDTLP